jgi:hypothetical protein
MVSQRQKEKISEYVKNGHSAKKIQATLRELIIGITSFFGFRPFCSKRMIQG